MAKLYLWYKVKVSEFISRNIARSLVSSGIGQSRLHHQATISSPCLYVEMLLRVALRVGDDAANLVENSTYLLQPLGSHCRAVIGEQYSCDECFQTLFRSEAVACPYIDGRPCITFELYVTSTRMERQFDV